jgi:hypothetical protein
VNDSAHRQGPEPAPPKGPEQDSANDLEPGRGRADDASAPEPTVQAWPLPRDFPHIISFDDVIGASVEPETSEPDGQ